MTYVGMSAKVEIAFVANPYSSALVWTDVTSRVAKLKTTTGRNYETGKNESSSVNVELRNNDGALNPMNTASPYYPYVLPFRPIRITATTTTAGPSYPIWYGYVSSWPQSVKDQTSQYEMVNVVGVDAFKAVLGFVPGDPYDVKVRKDYGAFMAPGLTSTSWDFWSFDETAAPFASKNTANSHPLTVPAGAAGPTKATPSPCRTALVFNGSQGVFNNLVAGGVTEMWFNTTTQPSTPGSAAIIAAGLSTANPTAVSLAYLTGIPKAVRLYLASTNTFLASGVALAANYANLMPSDNSASFETSVADWVSETTANVTIAQSTANPATGTGAMRATLTAAAGGVVSQTTRSTVTAGSYYMAGLSWAGSSTANTLSIGVRWYGSTGTLLSTSTVTAQAVAVGGNAYQVGKLTGPVQAPTGAVTASIILTTALSTGTTGTADLDAIGLYGATTSTALPVDHIAYTAPSAGATVSLYGCFGNTSTLADVFVVPAPGVGAWHHVGWAPRYNTSADTIFTLDGVAQTTIGTAATGNSFNGVSQFACLVNSGTVQAGVYYTGQIAGVWQMAPATGLNTVNVAYASQHYNYGTTATGAARTHDFPSEITSARVTDVLMAIGFPTAMTSLEAGLTTMSASGNVSGVTATGLLVAAAEAELGNVFVDRNGVVTFHNRGHRNSPTTAAVFGGDGNIPYEGNLVIGFDDTYIFNDVQITQAATSPAYVFEAQDVTSQNVYGVRTQQQTLQVAAQSDVQGMAATLLARYKDPRPRLATLSIELRSKPNYIPNVFGLHIGDLITVNHKPPGGTMFSLQCFIDGVSHTVDQGQWLVTYNTTPFYPNSTY